MVTWLRRYGAIAYLTVLVLAATGGSYWLTFHNAATIAQLCQAVNDQRHRQIVLWQTIITAAPAPDRETAVARRERLMFDQALMLSVERIFAPQNCQDRIPQNGPPPSP